MISANEQHHCRSGYYEELWIDFILNKLPVIKRQQLEQHLPSCIACREMVEHWGELLGYRDELADELAPNASSSEASEQNIASFPRVELSEKKLSSLQRYVKKQAAWHRIKNKAKQNKAILGVTAAAAAVLLLFPFIRVQLSVSNSEQFVDQYVQHYEPAAISFVKGVDSARYRVEAAEGQASSGYIWLKQDWSEAFLWLENLQQIGLNDYQAWAISGDQASSLGIIQLVGTEGHLYISPPSPLHPADFISLTIEPKGGSQSPTSKPIMLIVKQQ